MNSQWKAFLEARRAFIDDQGNTRFPGSPTEAACALSELCQLGLIAVSGADAADFLQGQLTNDVRELSESHTQLSSHCSPKGRMLSSFRVIKADDVIYLQLPRTKVGAVLQRLRMFVLRAQVALKDASDDLIAIGLSGDCAHSLLQKHLDTLPERGNGITRSGELLAIRMPGPTTRYQILGPEPVMETLWDDLAENASVVDPDYWGLMDIRAGVPTVYPETTDAFVPQMANMQLIDGVSFTKGCYTGQEVVARMQYLGKLKRRMYLGEVDAKAQPRPGDELHAPKSVSEQSAGRIVDARPNASGRYELLAVLEISAAEGDEVRLGPDGPVLTVRPPPYGFLPEG